jgi:hypothetical protein
MRLLLTIDTDGMSATDVIHAVKRAARTINAFVRVVESGIHTANDLWHPIRLHKEEKAEETRAWFTFIEQHPTAYNWPETERERQSRDCPAPETRIPTGDFLPEDSNAAVDAKGIPF